MAVRAYTTGADADAVRAFLTAFHAPKPRHVSRHVLVRRLSRLDDALNSTDDSLRRLDLLEARRRTRAALRAADAAEHTPDPVAATEAGFVEHAAGWAARTGVTFSAFRAAGVPAGLLRSAGITPD